MEIQAKYLSSGLSLEGKVNITFEFADKKSAMALIRTLLKQGAVTLDIGREKKKRSLDANALAWVLIGKIAAATGIPKTDVYREFVRNLGDNFEIVCVKAEAAQNLMSGWEHNGLGWITETTPSKLPGCVNCLLYYGSSTYDKDQMGRFLDLILSDCKVMGIETRPQEEIDALLGR